MNCRNKVVFFFQTLTVLLVGPITVAACSCTARDYTALGVDRITGFSEFTRMFLSLRN
jgi:hypothetical protein